MMGKERTGRLISLGTGRRGFMPAITTRVTRLRLAFVENKDHSIHASLVVVEAMAQRFDLWQRIRKRTSLVHLANTHYAPQKFKLTERRRHRDDRRRDLLFSCKAKCHEQTANPMSINPSKAVKFLALIAISATVSGCIATTLKREIHVVRDADGKIIQTIEVEGIEQPAAESTTKTIKFKTLELPK
jgi:hypothetical protein